MIGFFDDIPRDLEDAARIDGCSTFGAFFRVALPLAMPGIAASAILCFIFSWNDFLFAVVLTSPQSWPVTVALNNMAGSQIIAWNVQMAGSFLAAVPTLLVYIFLGRYFLRGLMSGALKG